MSFFSFNKMLGVWVELQSTKRVLFIQKQYTIFKLQWEILHVSGIHVWINVTPKDSILHIFRLPIISSCLANTYYSQVHSEFLIREIQRFNKSWMSDRSSTGPNIIPALRLRDLTQLMQHTSTTHINIIRNHICSNSH